MRIPDDASLRERIDVIAERVYGADGIYLLKTAKDKIVARAEEAGINASVTDL